MSGFKLPPSSVPRTPYARPAPERTDALRLDANEGNQPSDDALRSLRDLESHALRVYPQVCELQSLIAEHWEIDAERVVVTGGADDAIDRVMRAFLGPGRELRVPVPTFETLLRLAEVTGAEITPVPWEDRFPADVLMARLREKTRVIAVVSPNNPTGAIAPRDDFLRVSEAARQAGAVVLLDHVYAEYADEDLTGLALDLPNVVVVRTFSKAWGLAGCRVGYALASPELAAVLRNAGNPYPVSGASLAVVTGELERGRERLEMHVSRIRDHRARLTSYLRQRDVAVTDSHGNFVFAELGGRVDLVRDGLGAADIIVRHFANRARLAGGLRISVPDRAADLDRLIAALDRCLSPEALLLDMDGVLADVEASYRGCDLETARAFGVTITREELNAAIREGDANNDWVLTQRLMRSKGVEVSLDEVIARYQALYLGSDGKAGLRELERPLVARDALERLAARLPLGVVTGRPRDEARWFLERFALCDLFTTLVCMEDAAPKPSPEPVQLALERMNVSCAWMVGDTPDDARAALGAGVLALGVLAPGADAEQNARALREAGALVLDDLSQLEELLPCPTEAP